MKVKKGLIFIVIVVLLFIAFFVPNPSLIFPSTSPNYFGGTESGDSAFMGTGICGSWFVLGDVSGDIYATSICARLAPYNSPGDLAKCAIYDYNSNTLIAQTEQVSMGGLGVYHFYFNPIVKLTSNTKYWLVLWQQNGAVVYWVNKYVTVGQNLIPFNKGVSYGYYPYTGVFPRSLNLGELNNHEYFIYCEYDVITPPTVDITYPFTQTVFTTGNPIPIIANASTDTTKVSFYKNNDLLYVDNSAPFEYIWSDTQIGTYVIKAVADNGKVTASDQITITVIPLPKPPEQPTTPPPEQPEQKTPGFEILFLFIGLVIITIFYRKRKIA